LQQELMRRNDLAGNVFLLLRHTGMRIGECVDLSYDCLHSISPNQWAIHVPLGKLKTERMVPVDAFVRDLVHRLRFFRSLDPMPDNGRLLAWHGSRVSLLARLRDYLHLACHSAGLPTSIVPHQLRHTYGTEMLRAGVGFAAVMKLLGHTDPGMTMRYVDVTLTDLQREFQLARSQPRHLTPQPKTSSAPLVATSSSTPCSSLRISCGCCAAHRQTGIPALASTGSQTDSPRSSPKYANSKSTE
jgi:integrase